MIATFVMLLSTIVQSWFLRAERKAHEAETLPRTVHKTHARQVWLPTTHKYGAPIHFPVYAAELGHHTPPPLLVSMNDRSGIIPHPLSSCPM